MQLGALMLSMMIWGGVLAVSVLPTSAQNLRTGVEQLAEQLIKATPDDRKLRIAVADFQDLQNVTSDLGRFIASRLTTRLAQSPKFFVVERQRFGQVLAELRFSMTDLVDPEKAKQLGEMVGVEGILVGTLSDLGSQVDVDARIIEINTSRMLLSTTLTITKDHVVTDLLARGRATADTAAANAVPGHASTAHKHEASSFQNSFLRVTTKSMSKSEDQKKINLVVQVENISKEDLYVAFGKGAKGALVTLIDEAGTTFELAQLTGLSEVWPGMDREKSKENYSHFSPGSPSVIAMTFASGKESESTTVSFSADCFRYTKGKAEKFSIGMANMRIP
jgi:TolB-like protein